MPSPLKSFQPGAKEPAKNDGSEAVEADYIIVGGGSAGAVLARRLSEHRNIRVLLLEAGGEAGSLLVQIPVGFARLVGNPKFDWRYEQAPDPSINGRRFLWSGGRLLGGSSSINGQVFIRGTEQDFGHWASAGAAGWGFDDVLPYYIKSESWAGEPAALRGSTGPMAVAPMRDFHLISRTFLDGCAELGLPVLEDHNKGVSDGAFLTQVNQRGGWRCSTEKAYLRPVRASPNLKVVTGASVERVVIKEGRATGVEFIRGGRRHVASAAAEILLSAGAIGSPGVLLRSGIGPAPALQAAGITVASDRPEVGANLQEHSAASQSRHVAVPTLNSQVGPLDMLRHLARFIRHRDGVFSEPAVQAMALARTSDGLGEPDVQLHFMPLAYDIEPDTVSSASARMPRTPAVTITASISHPWSRGRVTIDEAGRPQIDHQLLGDPRDLATLVGAMKLVERLFQTSAMAAVTVGRRVPSSSVPSDSDWADFVRAKTMIGYHPVGTCRMGSDPAAVVDPSLRLNGTGGLRVIDASIMPRITATNTNATTIMIAEKAADMIIAAAR